MSLAAAAGATRRPRASLLLGVLALVAAASMMTGLAYGSFPTRWIDVFDTIGGNLPGVVHDVIWNLRAPRVLAAFACGGLLALAGALLQVLLRNPLADPFVLGVSSGASLAALAALAFGAGAIASTTAAFVGAVVAVTLIFLLAYRARDPDMYRVLLTGVVLSAGLSALISLTLALAPQGQLKGMLFWLMGDLTQAGSPAISMTLLAVLVLAGVVLGRRLDILAIGDARARSLGLGVPRLQLVTLLCASAATVAAVVEGGAIGFVGLMIPHALRLCGVTANRLLVPASALLGGSFLVVADTVARSAWAPQQLPVGIFTAILGVPAMLWLIGRSR
jgi:iron complex transport system permease protein